MNRSRTLYQLGILGREAYNFDQADPRFIGELLAGTLQQGSPFGGNFWTGPYANIRLANIIQRVVGQVPEFSAEEVSSIQGFSKTIEALDLLEVVNTHDTNGGVIDTDKELGDPLGAIVGKPEMFGEIVRLLDEGATDLTAGGEEFPFSLSEGYDGFDTPETFRTFNRAIRARVAIYLEDYPGALAALGMSFLDDTAMGDLTAGVFHSFSTGAGDQVNNLINPNLFAHPSLVADAQMNGTTKDLRLTAKVKMVEEGGGAGGLSSDYKFTIYTSPSSPVPIIRNEELILLKAEALYNTGDKAGALIALNRVRVASGGLLPLTALAIDTEAEFIDALLYERQYSLMFEGHRWIDLRRFMIDVPLLPAPSPEADQTRNVRYPIPLAECNARPGEAACALGSTN
ncbi:MAG: RagB/SusD family nutrient uptake outer membrane protein [Kofleriaceae bacterium]